MIDSLLSKVRRPSRYIDGEVNAYKKPWDKVDLRWCLAFPDAYEIGMSNVGLEILYHVINSQKDVLADRVYSPWIDMESAIREENAQLWGLESKKPLKDFDIIGITLPYELTYTNILTMLNLASIPFYSKERGDEYPLIIGGGVGAFNPEPIADLFDLIVLGDGEEIVLKISEIVKTAGSKKEAINKIAGLKGVYVPSLNNGSEQVQKAIVSDINNVPYTTKPLVPFMHVVHDRVGVEIQRGCARACRFCQAGYIYRPVRQRTPQKIEELASCGIKNSGNEDLSFLSLSAGDYELLPQILKNVAAENKEQWTNISLPSLRVETLTPEILKILSRSLKGGFTLAPEAATERLRSVINKGNTEAELLSTIDKVFASGWRLLKLYFMIGLPTETLDDVRAISDLAHKAYNIGKRYGREVTITVSVSTFIPKPFTPFQWSRQISIEETKERQQILKDTLRRRGIELKWHDAKMSSLEGIFSRGDRSLFKAIIKAWEKGDRFSAWEESFKYELWCDSFAECGIDTDKYFNREIPLDEKLPWEHLFAELDRNFLRKEYEKAMRGETTKDCVSDRCSQCGVCDFKDVQNVIANEYDATAPVPSPPKNTKPENVLLHFTYSKLGLAKWISHLELMMVFRRAFRRAGLPVSYSQGFHPHMKLSLEHALKVGEASESEKGKIEMSENIAHDEIISKMNEELPEGIEILSFFTP